MAQANLGGISTTVSSSSQPQYPCMRSTSRQCRDFDAPFLRVRHIGRRSQEPGQSLNFRRLCSLCSATIEAFVYQDLTHRTWRSVFAQGFRVKLLRSPVRCGNSNERHGAISATLCFLRLKKWPALGLGVPWFGSSRDDARQQ